MTRTSRKRSRIINFLSVHDTLACRMPVRMAVTGSRVSPPLIGSIAVLGKERALERIERTITTL